MDSGEKTATLQNPKIYAAIAGVISDCGFVSKDKVNKQQGFKYRSVDDVFNALHPALAKNKVFIVPTMSVVIMHDSEENLYWHRKMKYSLSFL